ncbi:atlastin-1-like [Centruroides sculpturatus]|uniref:atlastin-1-like n=1 Tax=Centruroides sculpturatus TaxID=218467 RepID=UPI000C6CA157|nr:atlastin-1-like [Centruroides sculpturatus]
MNSQSFGNKIIGQTGKPVLIAFAKNHKFELDENALKLILLRENVKDCPVEVISVSGAFRKGKSFLLNFILRYLQAKGSPNWMGSDDAPLKGFEWCGGSERTTNGIFVWSEVFFISHNGKQVAVLLMDTQGTFDSNSTVRECATVFALSTMISSIQVKKNIYVADDFKVQLNSFMSYLFSPENIECKQINGREITAKELIDYFKIRNDQHPSLKDLRRQIYTCFKNIDCFLMPHPGLKVSTALEFDGCLKDVADDFKVQLNSFMSYLFSPENIECKQINGREITAKELIDYFKAYIKVYQNDDLPAPKTIFMATAEINNINAVHNAKKIYNDTMERICGGIQPYLNPRTLYLVHLEAKNKAIELFNNAYKMGGEEYSKSFCESLEKDIENLLQNYIVLNDSKNITKLVETPLILITIAIITHFLAKLFYLIDLTFFLMICNIVFMICILSLGIWCYSRYSGEIQEIASQIENISHFFWKIIEVQVMYIWSKQRRS